MTKTLPKFKSFIFISFLLLIHINLFADVSSKIIEGKTSSDIAYIGLHPETPYDNPADNIFHVQIDQELCGDEEIWLVYETYGVASSQSVTKSINDEKAFGGQFIKLEREWKLQREKIHPEWLKEGDNVIRFTVPEGAQYGYRLRNLKLKIEEGNTSNLTITNFNQNDDQYYIRGFVKDLSSTLRIEGQAIKTYNGAFEAVLNNLGEAGKNSLVNITVETADGSVDCFEFEAKENTCPDFTHEVPSGFSKASRFFNSTEGSFQFTGASFSVPDSAILVPTEVSITNLRYIDIPPMDAGMYNVTSGPEAFRFLPHGTQFYKEAKIALPIDEELIPEGYTKEDVRTFYFDEQSHHWVPLPKDTLLAEEGVLVSRTTHFTDMINGVIQVPESPEVNAYNSTSMKGIKAANPTAGINLMQPPSANSMGNANMSYPINIPAGRNGMQPQLAISYNNGGGNGWMGLGWNLSIPSITIDTRWGVPRYDAEMETETYSMSGQQLTPVAHRGELKTRESEKQFYPRVEGGFQKIIRHEDSPQEYWWEVTDKSGAIYTYGKDTETVLTDGAGNRAYWALQEVKDLNGNSIKYEYERVEDSGTGDGSGTVKGSELYCSKITYTNHIGSEGKYSIHFIRNSDGVRRPDVTIDGRLGFKRVTADRLTQVEVKYNNENIRHYVFKYEEGVFYKSLLKTIEEYDAAGKLFTTHELEYYDDTEGGSKLFKPSESWSPGNDQLNTGLITDRFGFSKDFSAISGTKSKNGGYGATFTAGFNDGKLFSKSMTIGGSFGSSSAKSEGNVMLVDMNGDGLPDKLYKKGSKLFYRPNKIGQDGSYEFDAPKEILGAGSFMIESSKTGNGGFEAQAGFSKASIFVGYGSSNTTSVTSTYLSDVNGDQLIDIVNNGIVLFNNLDHETGDITFTTSPGDTPNPILKGGPEGEFFSRTQEEKDSIIRANPLHDMVRVWRAPFAGRIEIDAPVKLFPATVSGTDGVKVSIQHQDEVKWELSIEPNDQSVKAPSNVDDIIVDKGDEIYFRVQSIENGTDDQVDWSPVIRYIDKDLSKQDANKLPLYEYAIEDDFILTAPYQTSTPINGTIKIEGAFTKPLLTDDITVQILKDNASTEVLFEEVYSWDSEVSTEITYEGNVEAGEGLTFKIIANSNVDWTSIEWTPKMYYTASLDDNVTDVLTETDTLILNYPIVDYSLFANTRVLSEPYIVADEIDSLNVSPTASFDFDAIGIAQDMGLVNFSVKKKDSLLYQTQLQLTNMSIEDADTVKIAASKGDTLYLEYHFTEYRGARRANDANVYIGTADTAFTQQGSIFTVNFEEQDIIYGPLYRNWGHFAYNGNLERADQPIDRQLLKLSEALKSEQKGSDISNPEELENQDPYDPSKDIFIYLFVDNNRGVWSGLDEFTYLNSSIMSSSRLGQDNLSFSSGSTNNDLFRAISKINSSNNKSITAGGGIPGASGSLSGSKGNAKQLTDYMDLNGDRYPDVFTRDGVIFTLPSGALSSEVWKNFHTGDLTKTHTDGNGASINGMFKVNPKSGPNGGEPDKSDASDAKTNGSVNLNIGGGTNTSDYSWMDINGDGLADRVNSNGKVAISVGYTLLPEENWGQTGLQISNSTNAGGGLGFSVGSGSESASISAGLSAGFSDNVLEQMLQDVNGDGLVDDVSVTDSGVKVRLNTGTGFQGEYTWLSNEKIGKSSTSSESINASFTACVPLGFIPVKICVNPSGNGGQSVSRNESQLSDIDGDGYPDFLVSTKDDNLTVKKSSIARTNMLKTVERPLGATFTLDYKKYGNTYEHPSSLWALSTISVFDGHTGDGVDSLFTSFDYEKGYYDRHEREFYGFQKVISNTLAEENAEKPYTQSIRTFINDNYYEKGLLVEEVMTDGDGNLYMRKTNEFDLLSIENGNPLPANFAEEEEEASAFPALKSTVSEFYEGTSDAGKTLKMHYDYDAIGNVTQFIDEADDQTTEDDLTATIEYWDYATIKNAAKSIEVTANGKLYRKRTAEIEESTGNLKNIKQYLTDSEFASYDFEYDDYGNLTKVIRPENAEGQRFSIDYKYDEVVNTYPIEVSNSYGYSSEATYDYRYGQVLESIDLNGNKITNELDAVGRISKITGPYEQQGAPFSLHFKYYPKAETPWALTQHYDSQNRNNEMETATFVDGLGRVLQTKKDVAIYQGDGKPDQEMMVVSGKVNYDAFGRAEEAYYPILEDKGNLEQTGTFNEGQDDIKATETEYDVLNRAIKVTLPDLAITETSYGFGQDRNGNQQFATTTTDANGIVTEQFTDGKQRVTAVKNITEEGNVWTSFDYNPMSEQIAAINDLEHVTESEYDLFGRRTKRIHPDAGETFYSYDLSGNLTSLVTANLAESGEAITYKYDYNRLTDIEYPENEENNVHYTYGEAGADYNRAGRIVLQEDASGAQEFFYGALGEVVKNIRTVIIPQHDEQTYETQWEYDSWNRLLSMVYPDGEEVSYTYNEGGLLRSMEGKKQGYRFNYVEQLGYDKFEQRVFLAYGNGTKTNYTYEPERRRLKGMTAETSAGRKFMDNDYQYDAVNNILSLENKAEVPTSDLMGGSSSYTYEYDDLYRLTTASGQHTGSNHKDQYSLEMSYNTVGGITNKNQFHERSGGDGGSFVKQGKTTYELDYTYGSEQPNAPKVIGDKTYTYDANGNQTGWKSNVSGQERKILWDEENRIRSIADNGAAYHYVYDASGERVLKSKTTGQAVFKNGEKKAGNGSLGNFTVYVNPYIVLQSGGYTKHYFIEGQRIVSKIGGGIDGRGQGPLKAGNDKINYAAKAEKLFDGIVRNEKFIDEEGNLLTAGKSGKVPPGQIIGNQGNNGQSEPFRYFYHPDHLGSTSYITDATGEVYQHLEYFAFGETFVEEQGNTDKLPYKFNGKELDEETGLYYYGARYYDAKTSLFLEIDPLAEKFDGWNAYAYTFNNPLRYSDPTGMEGVDETGPTVKEAAKLADHVYNGKKGDVVDGWEMRKVYEDEENYGYRAGLYRRKNDDGDFEYVMANAGTGDWDDVSEDLEQPFGGSEHMNLSLSKARELNDRFSDASLTFVGHSKGGAEAAGNALATNRDAILFNPAAINSKAYGLSSKNYTGSMTAYIVKGEVLNSMLNWWSARPIDKAVYLPRQHGDRWIRNGLYYQVKNHMMSAVLSAIDEQNGN